MDKRRKLVIALGSGALTVPFVSFAQQGKVWRIGILSQRSRPTSLDADIHIAFIRGMQGLGYVEGKNLVIEWRFAENRTELLPVLAAELVALKVDVIVSQANAGPLALQKATSTIPIVMLSASDPVGSGLIKSLARPGGNITGLSTINGDLSPKRLELLRDMVPNLFNVAVLLPAGNPTSGPILESLRAAAKGLGVRILPVETQTARDVEDAFTVIVKQQARAMIVTSDPLFSGNRFKIAELATKHRLPSMTADRQYAEAGCLVSYGTNLADSFHRAATFVDKILKGAKPADLPVEQPTKFEMFINGKTAKALGLKIPQSMLVMADKIIE
jgi:putative ABC transport system substrate-binding protein